MNLEWIGVRVERKKKQKQCKRNKETNNNKQYFEMFTFALLSPYGKHSLLNIPALLAMSAIGSGSTDCEIAISEGTGC